MEYRLTGLQPASKYAAQIRSLNDSDTSEWSPNFYIITPRDNSVPDAPTSVVGFYFDNAFRFSWDNVNYNTNGTIMRDFASYSLRITDGTNEYTDNIQTANYVVDTTAWKTQLGSGDTVTIYVSTQDKYGNSSIESSASATADIPDNVANFHAHGGNGYISLTWSAVTNVPIDKYEIYVGDSPSFTPDTSGFTNLAGNSTDTRFQWDSPTATIAAKYFKIRAVSIFGGVSALFSLTASTSRIYVPGTDAPSYVGTLGAIGYWKLNETSGTSAIDYGTNNDPGIYSGASLNHASLLPYSGASAQFNGSSNLISITTTDYQTLSAQWTIAAIVKPGSTADGVIITPEWFTGYDTPFILAQGTLSGTVGTAGKFIGGWMKAGTWHTAESTTSVSAGTAYFVTVTYDGADVKMYVNAAAENTTTTGAQGTISSPTNHLYAGVDWNGSGRFYNGYMSDIQIYNRALTSTEISDLYTRFTTGPVGGGGSISPLTTKGDIYTFDTADARLPVGTNGDVLTADSTAANGVSWQAPTGGGGSSLTVKDEGTTLTTGATSIDFVGGAVTATHVSGAVTVTIPQDDFYSYGPNSTSLTTAYSTLTYVTGMATGSYILEFDADGVIYTGYMSWRAGTVTANAYNEIILNRSSLTAPTYLLSARIYGDPSDGLQKLQLQASGSITVTNLYVKIRRLI